MIIKKRRPVWSPQARVRADGQAVYNGLMDRFLKVHRASDSREMLEVPRFTTTDEVRVAVTRQLDAERRAELGQFMTPLSVARFMASLFRKWPEHAAVLDPGAGLGSLSGAFAERFVQGAAPRSTLSITSFEIEPILVETLKETMRVVAKHASSHGVGIQQEIFERDFIREGVSALSRGARPYSHVILNPPYRKIGARSDWRLLLREVGIETVNLYAAFLALTVGLAEEGGEIVAIVPRSFCNGTYFRPFREWLMRRAAIRHIHVFESRNKAFRDDDVLQENIILLLERGGIQSQVIVSSSNDATFGDYAEKAVNFDQVVKPSDREKFIHIPLAEVESNSVVFRHTLRELGLDVATGPVVDFRLRVHWLPEPERGAAPLLYAHHFSEGEITWPRSHKKPNALRVNEETLKWLMPAGWYTVVRRFSSKEERRRIVSYVVDPGKLPSQWYGFENHLNVLHANKGGLAPDVARGLAVFLNSTIVDRHFRTFSGHTQVNATDLRAMRFPDRKTLVRLGNWASKRSHLSQEAIDGYLEDLHAVEE